MEAWQLALLAWEGLKLLGVLIGAVDTPKPVHWTPPDLTPTCFFQESANPRPAVCPADFTDFTLPEQDAHWMVRR